MHETQARWLATRGYRALLGLFPADFRAEYGAEMLAVFEARWREAWGAAGPAGAGRWLLLALGDGLSSAGREHGEALGEFLEADPRARGTLALGAAFLVGTWTALFALGAQAHTLAGALLVGANAALVARALTRSTRYAELPAMAAMANTALLALLLAGHAAAAGLGLGATLAGLVAVGVHGHWLWGMRGEDLHLRGG